jgi:PAS domain S-box-containing protein
MGDHKNLKKSETLYRNLMEDNIDAVYLMDDLGKILDVNKAACSMLGYSREELLELCIPDIDPLFPIEHFKEFWSGKPKDTSILFQSRHRRKDGAEIPVEINGIFFSFEDGKYLYGIARDLTVRNSAEAMLQEEKTKLQNVIKSANVGTWEWNIQTGEASFDAESAALLGYALEELQPISMQKWMGLKAPEDEREARLRLEQHTCGLTEYYEYESRMKHKSGAWVWIQDRGKVTTWTFEGKPLKMFGIHADITARKQAEEALRLKNAELELLLKEVHHRIKNNMHTVQSLLSLKECTLTDPEAISALEDARGRLRSMMVLYDKLYRASDLTAISARDYLSTLIDEIIENYPTRTPVIVTKKIDDFILDMKRLQALGIIVNELITNIYKYAFPGCSDGAVTVSASNNGKLVTMVVEDNGCGIHPALDFENSRGFGLQLVKGLSAQIGGTVRMESIAGTRIVVEFPLTS